MSKDFREYYGDRYVVHVEPSSIRIYNKSKGDKLIDIDCEKSIDGYVHFFNSIDKIAAALSEDAYHELVDIIAKTVLHNRPFNCMLLHGMCECTGRKV